MKQSIGQYVMIVLLVVGAYMVGVYKTKSEYLEKGETAKVAEVAGEQAPAPEEKTELTEAEWQKAQGEGYAYAVGEESAPVTIVEFTDYQCPFCERYYTDTYGKLMTEYVQAGKVRYIERDLPLPFHPNAEPAAIAARCAGQQERAVEMHTKLFGEQASWVELSDPTEQFVKLAGQAGVNQASFRSCLTDESVKQAVEADAALAGELGANGTPTFMINGKLLVGAQPFASFKEMIEAEL